VCEATFPDPATAEAVRRAYNDELTRRYQQWGAALKRALSTPAGRRRSQPLHDERAARRLARLRQQLERIQAHDRFAAEGREAAEALLARATTLDARAEEGGPLTGLRWVTRRGLHVDRIACAWVVRRFIDRHATFRFTTNPAAPLASGEIGFDMPGAAIGHHGGGCSMETLIERAGLTDRRLRRVADIVHDIDLKDGRHRHPETAGFEQLLVGLITSTPADDDRLEQGLWLFDTLYAAGVGAPTARTAPRIRVPPSLRRRGR
jgi:hypothetical protein